MIVSFSYGLPKLIASDFRGAQTFPIEISKTPLTAPTEEISITGNMELSVWIKLPNRQIETKDFIVSVTFIPADNSPTVSLSKEFGFWHTRSSFGQGQYYKVGVQRFENDFEGQLLVITEGEWRPKYNAFLILQETEEDRLNILLPYLIIFVSGILLLVLGLFFVIKSAPDKSISDTYR